MSLLLDALKKSGDKQNAGGLTLEELTPSRSATAVPPASAPSRAAGATLFAAKQQNTSRLKWKLGLVPTTLLLAFLFSSGYGYYVWLQLQPPSQPRTAQRAAVPPPPAVAPRAFGPAMAAAPALVPQMPPRETSRAARRKQPAVTADNEDLDAPRDTPKTARNYPRKPAATGVSVQRKMETDTITPALLSAYQSYQRGDYMAAAQGYREVLGKDEHNRDALLGLAAIAQQQGQLESAQGYYRQLLVLDPGDPVAQAALMAYAPDAGNTESRLKLLLAGHPRSGALHFALGNYYANEASWGDAQQYYFNAHTLEPANAQFAFNLAVSLDHLGKRKLAAQYYQQALQLDASGRSGFDHAQAQQRLNELTPAD